MKVLFVGLEFNLTYNLIIQGYSKFRMSNNTQTHTFPSSSHDHLFLALHQHLPFAKWRQYEVVIFIEESQSPSSPQAGPAVFAPTLDFA